MGRAVRHLYAICTPLVRHRYAIGTPSAGVESGSRGGRLFVVRTVGGLICFLCCVNKYAKTSFVYPLYVSRRPMYYFLFFLSSYFCIVIFNFCLVYIEYIRTPSLLSFVHAAYYSRAQIRHCLDCQN